jgi:transposase
MLDLILEVPATYVPALAQERRVLGFDWGVRSLLSVSILEKPETGDEPYKQVSRPLFLDTGGIDGRQARLRREIDRLKACKQRYISLITQAHKAQQEQQTPLPAHLAGWQARVEEYEGRIRQCWKTYARRNRELAHLAANLLILLALLFECRIICGENLSTLKSVGRGRGVRGRFRNWRNNSTVRGEVWRVLKYKCHLAGIRTRMVEPRGTTHTCPRCLTPVKGHHFSGGQPPTSSGKGSMPNVSLAPERADKDHSMTPRQGEQWFQQTGASLRAISTWRKLDCFNPRTERNIGRLVGSW